LVGGKTLELLLTGIGGDQAEAQRRDKGKDDQGAAAHRTNREAVRLRGRGRNMVMNPKRIGDAEGRMKGLEI